MVSKEAWREQQINVSTHPDRGCALPPSTLAFLSDIFQHLHRVTGRLVTLNVMGLFLVGNYSNKPGSGVRLCIIQ